MALRSAAPRVLPLRLRAARSSVRPMATAQSEAFTSATDNDFAAYAPKTAVLFPGQGAQAVGMAKVRRRPANVLRKPRPSWGRLLRLVARSNA